MSEFPFQRGDELLFAPTNHRQVVGKERLLKFGKRFWMESRRGHSHADWIEVRIELENGSFRSGIPGRARDFSLKAAEGTAEPEG